LTKSDGMRNALWHRASMPVRARAQSIDSGKRKMGSFLPCLSPPSSPPTFLPAFLRPRARARRSARLEILFLKSSSSNSRPDSLNPSNAPLKTVSTLPHISPLNACLFKTQSQFFPSRKILKILPYPPNTPDGTGGRICLSSRCARCTRSQVKPQHRKNSPDSVGPCN
jgi:hypothetical protein